VSNASQKRERAPSEDSESVGSLADFIVEDDAVIEDDDDDAIDEDDIDEECDDDSDDDDDEVETEDDEVETEEDETRDLAETNETGESGADFIEDTGKQQDAKLDKQGEDLALLVEETKKITEGLTGTVVNGRTLRSRDPSSIESRKPRDMYYERFGREQEQKVMEKFTKKDIIEYVSKLKVEFQQAYEQAGNVWPSLTMKMSLEKIQEEYRKIKLFAELPDSDNEDDDNDELNDDEYSEDI